MLDYLDAVPWAALHHAYGSAEDVPGNIRRLTSDDPADWVAAIDALSWTIYHQGTVYDATARAVPYLIRLAGSPAIKCRARILELLAEIAAGRSYLDVHGPPPGHEHERDTPEYQAALAEELAWARDARDAVWNGCSLFLALLSDPDRRIRIAAGFTLGRLCEASGAGAGMPPDISDALRRRLDEEPDALVKAGQVCALATLADHDPEALAALRRQLEAPASPAVELAAALALVGRKGDPPVEAIDVLVRALTQAADLQDFFSAGEPSIEQRHQPLVKAYEKAGFPIAPPAAGDDYHGEDAGTDEDFHFPWFDWGARFEVIVRLCQLPPRHLDRTLPALLAALRDESPYTVDRVSKPILGYLFEGTKPSGASDLTAPQRAALETLFANEALFNAPIGNWSVVLDAVGLPHAKWQWERLLDLPGWRTDTEDQVLANLDRFVRHSAKRPEASPVTDDDRQGLTFLNLDGIVNADAYTPHLGQFPNLEVLRLCQSAVTDQGLRALPALPKLKELYLYGNPITDEGAVALGRFPTLEVLYLNKNGVGDQGVQALAAALPGLRVLILIATAVTDAAVPALAGLGTLEELNLRMTSVSPEGLHALRQSLPRCKVMPRE